MIGGAVGSVAGSIAGSNVGSGTGRVLSSVLGSVLGSIAGGTVGNNMTKNYSQEITVKLNNGRIVKIVLKIDTETPELKVGDEVNVVSSGGKIYNVLVR
jgi:outer membrane lipoprotein SlyB